MSTYIVFDTQGRAIQNGFAPDGLEGGQVAWPCSVVTGPYLDLNYYFSNGVVMQIPASPSPYHTWAHAEKAWKVEIIGVIACFVRYAQDHLDATAHAWGYDDIRSACSYVGDPYPRFHAEGTALRNWRSAVWAYLDAASTQPLPDPLPTMEEFSALLPAIPQRPA